MTNENNDSGSVGTKLDAITLLLLNFELPRQEKAKILVKYGYSKAEVARMLGMDKSNFRKMLTKKVTKSE